MRFLKVIAIVLIVSVVLGGIVYGLAKLNVEQSKQSKLDDTKIKDSVDSAIQLSNSLYTPDEMSGLLEQKSPIQHNTGFMAGMMTGFDKFSKVVTGDKDFVPRQSEGIMAGLGEKLGNPFVMYLTIFFLIFIVYKVIVRWRVKFKNMSKIIKICTRKCLGKINSFRLLEFNPVMNNNFKLVATICIIAVFINYVYMTYNLTNLILSIMISISIRAIVEYLLRISNFKTKILHKYNLLSILLSFILTFILIMLKWML